MTAVLMMALATGCSRFDVLNAAVPARGYERTPAIAYGTHKRQKLDVYYPKKTQDDPPSIVIFFYGGTWQQGKRANYRFVGQALTSRGFIAVLPDHRLFPEVTYPAFVEDGAQAVKWVYDNAEKIGGDKREIYLMGHSSGAHIATMLTLDPSYLEKVGMKATDIRATASLSSPYDFVPRDRNRLIFNMQPGDTRAAVESQPVHYADGNDPPMLLIQGSNDIRVDPRDANILAGRIRENGGQVKVIYYDIGHILPVQSLAYPFRRYAPVLDDVTAYFREIRQSPRWTPRPQAENDQ